MEIDLFTVKGTVHSPYNMVRYETVLHTMGRSQHNSDLNSQQETHCSPSQLSYWSSVMSIMGKDPHVIYRVYSSLIAIRHESDYITEEGREMTSLGVEWNGVRYNIIALCSTSEATTCHVSLLTPRQIAPCCRQHMLYRPWVYCYVSQQQWRPECWGPCVGQANTIRSGEPVYKQGIFPISTVSFWHHCPVSSSGSKSLRATCHCTKPISLSLRFPGFKFRTAFVLYYISLIVIK